MPRPIFLGNRRLHVNLDDHYAVRDLFWPSVGFPNHLSGHKIRLGIFADGRLSWLDDVGWHRELGFKEGARVSTSLLKSDSLHLQLQIEETVLRDADIWLRKIQIKNLGTTDREILLFQTHDLRINESDIGDCCYFDPGIDGLIHYKDGVWIGFCGQANGKGPDQYSCGIKAWAGLEGTWRDAEDGVLGGKPIEQGSVDSTMRFSVDIRPGEIATIDLSCAAATDYPKLGDVFANVPHPIPESHFAESGPAHEGIDSVSLAVIETHFTPWGGLIAASDSAIMETARANYCYVWLRDTALTLETLHQLGFHKLVAEGVGFFSSCQTVAKGCYGQKYNINGSLGAGWHPRIWEGKPCLPIQEDETALVATLTSLIASGLEPETKQKLVAEPAKFMSSYLLEHHQLPDASWDLWEERRGTHLWTSACVIEGLEAAGNCLEGTQGEQFLVQAGKLKAQVIKAFVSQSGFIARTITSAGASLASDSVTDSSILAALLRPPFHDRLDLLELAVKQVREKLLIHSRISGMARYENDYYFRRYDHYAGNPWVICTMWYAKALYKIGQIDEARYWLDWVEDRKSQTGTLAEQYDPETGEPLSVAPLVWSHAEYLDAQLLINSSQG